MLRLSSARLTRRPRGLSMHRPQIFASNPFVEERAARRSRKVARIMTISLFISKRPPARVLASLLATAAALTIGFSGAQAADVAAPRYVKAPAKAAEPAWNWSGFYLGADVGGVAQTTASGRSDFFQSDGEEGGGTPVNNPQSQTPSSSAVIGGVHAGYNWQISHLVLGVEGDWQWTGARSSFCRETDETSLPCSDNDRGFLTVNGETRGIGTIRGRVGYAFDRVMVYGTGGVAFVDLRDGIAADCRVEGCGFSSNANLTSANFSMIKTGWVAGAGVEWMLSPNWILRSEYLHVDAGTVSDRLNLAQTNCNGDGPCGASWSHGNRYDIGRVGVSYKFDGSTAN
jgi:outer membrane immunogenic protein